MAAFDAPALREKDGAVLVQVRVQPRASRTEITGWSAETGAIRVRLKSPPVDGAANDELVRFLGRKVLKVPPSDIEIVHGHRGRDKTVAVRGLDLETVRRRLGG